MAIKNPKRILFLGARDAGILDVVKGLTGSAPAAGESGSIAGLTHELSLQTEYYSATVPIWIDELADAEAWKAEFLKPEAEEVVNVIGAWILCFRGAGDEVVRTSEVQKAMDYVRAVIEHHGQGYASESAMLAVTVPAGNQPAPDKGSSLQEEAEEKCMEFGFEYIDYAATGSNEYGEKVGLERLREVLETAEWDVGDDEEDGLDLDDLDADDPGEGLNRDEAEMTAEIFGTNAALHGGDGFDTGVDDFMLPSGQASQVDDLDRLMAKLLHVRESSADLPVAQRKRLAAQAVKQLLRGDRGEEEE